MSACAHDEDGLKLVRDGTAQAQRLPEPLNPETVPVHGREPAHAMIFAREYARFLRYVPDASPGDEGAKHWQPFFDSDVSVVLAAAAMQDVDRYRRVLLACFRYLEDPQHAGDVEEVRHHFGFIFGAIGTLVRQLDRLLVSLPAEIALKATLTNLVKARLAEALERLVRYYNADQQEVPSGPWLVESALDLPQPQEDHHLSILGTSPAAFGELLAGTALSMEWLRGNAWEAFKSTSPDASVFGAGTTPFERAHACVRHALFSRACDAFLRVYARVAELAGGELARTLGKYPKHAPHYALFLTFLQAFEHARKDINLLSGKHLDHYYRRILRLAEQTAQPCQAHVVLELTRFTDTYELEKGTEFKGGKDARKKPIVFTGDEQLVANKATVASIMSLWRDEGTGPDAQAIYVSSAARTAGEAWHPFESSTEVGSFGFSIASHYLHLAEGTRTIELALHVREDSQRSVGELPAGAFVCRFTTKDGWLELAPDQLEFEDRSTLVVKITLDGNQPGVTAYDVRKHKSVYDVALPILELRLEAEPGMLGIFADLESVVVETIDLEVRVEGFRSLTLSTDLGPVDASKPFLPFGPSPAKGSAFVLGCQEAFCKKGLEEARLDLVWRGETEATKVAIDCLFEGAWQGSATIVDAAKESPDLSPHLIEFNPTDDPALVFGAPYDLACTSGYVRLALQGSFGHETYASELGRFVAGAKDAASLKVRTRNQIRQPLESLRSQRTAAAMPEKPYTPELERITLSYRARQSIGLDSTEESAFTARRARFYHVTTFGLAEQHAHVRSEVTLLPQLRHQDAMEVAKPTVLHDGELYIGLSGVEAPQNVALLFQVVDGSADPETTKPDPHLHFSYLRGSDWVAFASSGVDDRTSELLSSGIITFSIPEDATTTDTLLPGKLTWIRIAVAESTSAVCKLLDVRAQALRVTFSDRENDTSFLAAPLPAGTIGKLVTPVVQVKSVEQPFESFGGRMREAPNAFRTRVSERLRHKDRAIALWDYERIVLAAFPAIHRVKCQNHTRFEPSSIAADVYQELAAGHVTVVTIPAVSAGYSGDPLTPFTSLGVLEQIKELLEARRPCFAQLHVTNPSYERLRVACKVRLRNGVDETWCLEQIRVAITRFLAPWAYDARSRPSFGGRVHRSALIDLVEELEYVDYVADFHLFRDIDGPVKSEALEVVVGSRSVSVLTSVEASEHEIEVIHAQESSPVEICGCAP